jgi:acyl-CoA dehydrogenase
LKMTSNSFNTDEYPKGLFELSERQQRRMEEVREIARTVLVPLAHAGIPGTVNRPLLKAMGDRGLLQGLFPKSSSGKQSREVQAMELCILRESLASVNTEAETALALQGLGAYPILQSGSQAVVDEWIPRVASGTAVAAFALSEARAGSDAAALELQAEPDGNGWRLSGEKIWISNAPEADIYTVFARTTPDAGARGVTAFAVPGAREGVGGEHIDLVAPHPIGSVTFDAVRVDRREVLGEVDRGFRVAMRTLDLFRPSVGAFAVGMGQAALEAAVSYTATREAFGGHLADQQAVSHALANMATQLEAARLLVYAAGSAYDRGASPHEITTRSAMAKLYATETAQFVIDSAIQLHGARGLVHGHLLEHLYREVRATRIYEGASEIQRTIIGRSLFRSNESMK